MHARRLRRFKVLVDAGVFLDLPVFTPPPPPADYRMRSIAQVGAPAGPALERARVCTSTRDPDPSQVVTTRAFCTDRAHHNMP